MTYAYILAFTIIWIRERPKIKLFNRKPFNCELCLAFWATFWFGHYNVGEAALVALAAPLTLNIYNKVWFWTMK